MKKLSIDKSQLGGLVVMAVIVAVVLSFIISRSLNDTGTSLATSVLPGADPSQPVTREETMPGAEPGAVIESGAVPADAEIPDDHSGSSSDQVAKVVSDLEQRLIESPDDFDLMVELGALYFELRVYPRAADMFAAALEIDPDDAAVRSDLASSFLYQGMVGLAQKEYLKAIEIDPDLTDAYFNLGVSYSHGRTQDIEAAIAVWKRVIELEPDSEIAKTAEGFIREYADEGESGTPDSEPAAGS